MAVADSQRPDAAVTKGDEAITVAPGRGEEMRSLNYDGSNGATT
jgi:hypothetical protein